MMSGNYGLPVPQHSAKLGGSSLFLHHSRAGSVDSSGRNSPVQGWGENGQVTTENIVLIMLSYQHHADLLILVSSHIY